MVALVLLPGLDGTGTLFKDFTACFGPELQTIVASYPTNTVLGYADLEAIARTFLPQDQPYFLLGESFSGPLAITIAASRPPGLLGVILCCSFARSPRPMLALLRPLLPLAPIRALPQSLIAFFVLGRYATPTLKRALASSLALVEPAVLKARARAALSVDVSAALSDIRVPILYLRATQDRVVPRAAAQSIRACAPATQIVDFPAPHFLLQTLPTPTAAVVRDFIKQHAAT